VQGFDELPFTLVLLAAHLHPQAGAEALEPRFQLGQGHGRVDPGFTVAQQVQVGTVEHQYFHAITSSSWPRAASNRARLTPDLTTGRPGASNNTSCSPA